MGRQVSWSKLLLRNHYSRPKAKPKIELWYANRRGYHPGNAGVYLEKLLKSEDRAAHETLVGFSNELRHKPGSPIVWSRRDKWLLDYLEKNPKIKRKYFKALYKHGYAQGFNQQTNNWRLSDVDYLMVKTVKELHLKPKSFLDVGAAFQAKDCPPALTTSNARTAFKFHKFRMRYHAIDVVPIERAKQLELLKKEKIFARQVDYVHQPIIGKYSIIRFANVSMHQGRTEYEATLKHIFDALEMNGLLVIYNETGRPAYPGTNFQLPTYETGIYQKVVERGKPTLKTIHYKLDERTGMRFW
jgi:hypothetical protein